jgi:hypothetical protein
VDSTLINERSIIKGRTTIHRYKIEGDGPCYRFDVEAAINWRQCECLWARITRGIWLLVLRARTMRTHEGHVKGMYARANAFAFAFACALRCARA